MVKTSSSAVRVQSRSTLCACLRWDLLIVLLLGIYPTTVAFLSFHGSHRPPRPAFSVAQTPTPVRHMATATPPQKIRRKKWDDMIPRLREHKEKFGNANVTSSDDPELYEWIRKIRHNYVYQVRNVPDPTGKRKRLTDEKMQVLKDLNFVWETEGSLVRLRWKRLLERLKTYKEIHGHTYVDKDSGDEELYKWAKSLRYTYRHQALNLSTSHAYRPHLSPAKMKQLMDLGFDWELKRKNGTWENMLPRLAAYKQTHGHTIVKETDDPELHRWTTYLAKSYGPQLANSTAVRWHQKLSDKKLQELRDLEFTWETRASKWKRRYEELRAFRRKHGHCNPVYRDHPQLSNFVQNQRQEFRRYLKGNTTTLTQERIRDLNIIQFDWARPHDVAWAERKGDLEQFLENHGHVNVPQRCDDNFKLGQWCMNQRTNLRLRNTGNRTGLTFDRIRKLDKINFQWAPRAGRWHVMADRLRAYQEEHGHMEIATADSGNHDLRQWLNEQRYFYHNKRESRLSPQRIEILESIPDFSWRRRRKGPSKGDWSDLFVAIREKGIQPGGRAKQHIFDGAPRFDTNVKTAWTEQDLLALWNEEDDDDEGGGDEGEFEVDEGDFFEDEASRMFVRG